MPLRPYQQNDKNNIVCNWANGHRFVLYVLATGGGKTVVLVDIVKDFQDHQVIIAHRQELVSQISLTLAMNQIPHNIIAPDALIKQISFAHVKLFHRSFIDPWAKTHIAGVDTIVRRLGNFEYQQWASKIKQWVVDEAHHALKHNKWGKVLKSFVNARGLGVTATPTRTDGYGLGYHNDGMFEVMVHGPSMSDLITMGYLTPYRIFCPPSNLDLSSVSLDATGDYSKKQTSAAVQQSTIFGDAVEHFKMYASDQKGITFCTDMKAAEITTRKFNEAGVNAMLVNAKTPIVERVNASVMLKNGQLQQLVNVDIFGEGYDLPAVSTVTMLRPTASLNLCMQQFGRALRILEGKTHALIFDHVGNIERHGLPDMARTWSLEPKKKRTKSDPVEELEIPLTTCKKVGCFAPYDARLSRCPYCNSEKIVILKTSIRQVKGNLVELHPDVINRLKGERAKIDNPPHPPTTKGEIIYQAVVNRQRERKQAQIELRDLLSQWAGNRRFLGRTDDQIYIEFYRLTGTDMLTVQSLGAGETRKTMRKLL